MAPMIATTLDPLRSIAAVVRIVRGAEAGIVLTRAGTALPLPDLPTIHCSPRVPTCSLPWPTG
jgi:hypothetical protein